MFFHRLGLNEHCTNVENYLEASCCWVPLPYTHSRKNMLIQLKIKVRFQTHAFNANASVYIKAVSFEASYAATCML